MATFITGFIAYIITELRLEIAPAQELIHSSTVQGMFVLINVLSTSACLMPHKSIFDPGRWKVSSYNMPYMSSG